MNVKDIISLMESPSDEDIALITKAYDFAEKAHKGQERYSGEPYFVHPVETAKNLAEIGMGAITISAGLLHDTIEDGNVKEDEIEREFGKEILFLVQGVTKLGHLHYHDHERYIESLRKLFIAISEDIRVLIIKLADRLHNMRTLDFRPPDKQIRISKETLEIYAPLSDRLGIWRFTRELEDLSFKYVYPEQYKRVSDLVKQRSKEVMPRLEKFKRSLLKELAMKGMKDVSEGYRIKNLYSLYKKLERRDWDMEKIYDLAAIRIIVPTVDDCYRALGIIHGKWRPLPGRIKDYIAVEKPNGYQSIHTTIFTGDGGIMEIQIRTPEMHRKAEFGIASHIAYKEQQRNKKPDGRLVWVKNLIPLIKKNDKNDTDNASDDIPNWIKQIAESQILESKEEDFMEGLREDFVNKRVFVFTPKGDVVDLPIDSSPIDFAYAIHSDIGDHIFGSIVNGKLVALDYKLKNGDRVEIQTRHNSRPSQKWLDIAKTSLAKKCVRAALEKENSKR